MSFLAVTHRVDVQNVPGFLAESDAVIANAETQFTSSSLQFLDVAFSAFREASSAKIRLAVSRSKARISVLARADQAIFFTPSPAVFFYGLGRDRIRRALLRGGFLDRLAARTRLSIPQCPGVPARSPARHQLAHWQSRARRDPAMPQAFQQRRTPGWGRGARSVRAPAVFRDWIYLPQKRQDIIKKLARYAHPLISATSASQFRPLR